MPFEMLYHKLFSSKTTRKFQHGTVLKVHVCELWGVIIRCKIFATLPGGEN